MPRGRTVHIRKAKAGRYPDAAIDRIHVQDIAHPLRGQHPLPAVRRWRRGPDQSRRSRCIKQRAHAQPIRTVSRRLDLGNPDLDWIPLAKGMSVERAHASTLEEFADLLTGSFRREGPFLIESLV